MQEVQLLQLLFEDATDQDRAKNCSQMGTMGCCILQIAQKALMIIIFHAYFCVKQIKLLVQ